MFIGDIGSESPFVCLFCLFDFVVVVVFLIELPLMMSHKALAMNGLFYFTW